jgi:hypothetical protein
MLGHHAAQAFQHLVDGLVELRLAGVAPDHLGQDRLKLFSRNLSWGDQFCARDFVHQALADLRRATHHCRASASSRPTNDLSRCIVGSRPEVLVEVVVMSFPFQRLRKSANLQEVDLQGKSLVRPVICNC